MNQLLLSLVIALGMNTALATESETNVENLAPAEALSLELGIALLNGVEVENEAFLLEESELTSEESKQPAELLSAWGRPGPWGRPGHRGQVVCWAKNRRGMRFSARGFRPQVVQQRAINNCYDQSRGRGPGRDGWGRVRVRCFAMGCNHIGPRHPGPGRPGPDNRVPAPRNPGRRR